MAASNRRSELGGVQLPDLDQGMTLLTADTSASPAIHALAVDHVLRSGGEGVWIDPGTHAQTGPLVEIAPSDRILDRLRVARGFTPFQHLDLLRELPDLCSDRTTLVVVPHLDRQYRADSLLAEEGTDMLLSGIASLARTARKYDLAVLVTRTAQDQFSEPVDAAAAHTLDCQQTRFGPRFRAEDHDTLVYPVEGTRTVQTTLSYWADLLAARTPLYDAPTAQADTPQEVSARGSN
jgi:hypothetical protein